jgi:Bacterial TSP3 repeat
MQTGSTRVLGILLFTLIGASALVLGIMSTNKNISAPFSIDPNATARVSAALSGDMTAAALEALKKQDTDGDSLSDYDELNAYHTSPYIKDSDSDAIPDGVEIKNGTNPNCPEGKDCGVPAPLTNVPAANSNNGIDLLLPNSSADDASSGNVSAKPSASEIRSLLKEQGLGDNILSTVDDKTLLDLYEQSVILTGGANLNPDK